MPDYFQIDLGLTEWRPSTIQALLDELGRSFEVRVQPEEVQFYGGDAFKQRRPLVSDADVQGFCCAPSAREGEQKEEEEQSEQHIIRTALPEKISAEIRQPKRLATLASGRQLSKFAGEANGQDIEFSLKVFDCGHFRLKQVPISSGSSSPSAAAGGTRSVVLEGRWEQSAKGMKLEFLLGFACQMTRRRLEDGVTYEPVPAEVRTAVLSFPTESEDLIRGTLPTSLADGPVMMVQLHREADRVAKQQREDDDWETQQMLKPSRPLPRPQPPKPRRNWDEDWESDEPTWPMYLGIFLFIVIFLVFAWLWYEERYSTEAKKDFDEL